MKKLIMVSLLFGSCMAGSSDFSSNGLLVRLMGLLESVGTGTTSIQGEQTLSGYLKDEDGNAIVNATLNLQSEASSVLRATNTTTTDSEGKFSLTFKIGSYKVTVQSSTGSSLGIYSVSATNPNIQPTLTLQSGNLTLTVNNFNNSSAPLSPSLLTFGSSSYTFTSGLSISKITPTVSGTLTSCTARPSLPTGLSLSSTCEISGTPNVIQSSVAYLIRGRNSFGDTISKITITINRQPPSSLSYIGSPFTFTQGAFISTITPSVSGTVTSCSISPSLTSDTGLLFNTTNCSISGTATQVKSATNYTVTASNSNGSTSTTINITVNNSPPSGLNYSVAPFVFTQNVAISSRAVSVTGTVTSCSISPNLTLNTGLTFNITNCSISGTPTLVSSATNYTVTASNSNGSTTNSVSVAVNIAPPSSLSYSGSPFTFTQNLTISSRTPSVTGTINSCSITPNLTTDTGLTFNTTNCTISGTPTIIKSATNYTVTASNSNGSTSTTVNITVNIAPPSSLSYSGSPFVFTQNIAITSKTPTVTGTVTSCSISPNIQTDTGLNFNNTNCVISGTPTVIKSATNYTVTASNSNGSTNTTVSITVNIAPPSSLSYSGSPYTFTQNVTIATQTPTFTGSVTSCTTNPTLPTGLGINGTTCVISGTPTVVQTATNYTVTATNSSGSTTATISITVNIAPPSSLSYSGSPYTFTQNTAISAKTPTFTGSVSSCTISPALPTGLGINGTTCVISGTPTVLQSATNYTVTATNSSGSTTASISIIINVTPPSSLSYTSSPFTFTQNTSISAQTPTFTGSVSSCTTNPTFPTGLGINGTTCAISGTPTVIQSATNYTVTATNSSGSSTATISITVNIAPPSSLSYSGSPFTFTQNTAISARTPTFIGSVTSCTTSPTLPTGLGINGTTCVISGTPTIVQSATTYTITATNSSGSTTAAISIAVNLAPPSSLSYSSSPYTFTQNVAIASQTPTFSGSVTSCTTSPTLPTGLGINGTTCVISGTPTVVQSATSYTVTATNSSGSTTATINITVNIAPPSSLSYSGSPFTFTQNTAISARTPTFTGSVSSCTITPTLPSGLGINGTTCVISGTPTVVQSATSYTITATNSSGSTTASISITVNIAPPSSLSYSGSPYTFTQNVVIASQIPILSGSVTSCTTSPALPTGLGINGTTCVISGTPTVVQSVTNYTVTATNSSGFTTATITITVNILQSFVAMPSGLLKTGQTTSYITGDDGFYQKGISRIFINGGASGLFWQRCSAGQNNDATCSGTPQKLNWTDANNYCTNLNLAGKSWRLPNPIELNYLVDNGKFNPSIDPNLFPSTKYDDLFWTSSTYYINSAGITKGWTIAFYGGYPLLQGISQTYYVRCISSTSLTPSSLTDNNNGIITDNSTGLVWQKCSIGQNLLNCSGSAINYLWNDAITQCENLALGSRSDWRLPNINELKSITNFTSSPPFISNQFFTNTQFSQSDYYWSSTSYSFGPNYALAIRYYDGGLNLGLKNSLINGNNYVRCVTGP